MATLTVTSPVVETEIEIHTIDSLLRHRAHAATGNEPIVAYPFQGSQYTYYTPRQLHALVEAAAIAYSRVIPQRRTSQDAVQVVGLLGPSDFEYLITLLAVSRLGHTVLLLSTRIAEDAYVSLVEATQASFLVAAPSAQAMAQRVADRTGILHQPVLTHAEYVVPDQAVQLPQGQLDGRIEAKHIAWVIHSSGSTGPPKPIYQTHAGALNNYANNFGLKGFITLPLFHAHGISCLFRALHAQQLIYMYNADLPLTSANLLATLQDHPEIQVLYAVPYGLKLLCESTEGLAQLAQLKLVMFGGSSCPKPIGDKLVQHGVLLVSHYGTTETGQLMTSFRERADLDWDYVRPGASLLPYLRWEEQTMTPGIYELCILDGWPSKVASNRPDGSYATQDLFERHPSTPNAWRYYARRDDTLVLENGEKANPLVVEGVARNHAIIGEAIAFGASRSRLGLFLVRAAHCTAKSDEEVIDAVFPAIEQCNAESPGYAYLARDMIRVLPAETEFRKTDKGTVIRAAFYRDFQAQINQVYDMEDASGDQVLEAAELVAFLRKSLLEIAPIEPAALQDSTDIFGLGVDSLQSIRLRSMILKTLSLGGQRLAQNFVFEHPSLEAMTRELTRLRQGGDAPESTPVEDRMAALIEKYSRNFKDHVSVPRDDDGEHVVVTGSTGSLGAHIVAQLTQTDRVRTIYCLVRADSPLSALQRVRQSLHARGLSHHISPAAERKIVALPADLSNPLRLGLGEAAYKQVVQTATTVIHCAWSVNFNWALESFEASCIAATRHLLDLCLETRGLQPARFAFCSSVSAVARTPGNWVPESLPESFSHAQAMGYAQSKLVTEHIVNRASRHAGMSAHVLRVGQIVADTVHGIWNSTEAIPMILQTAATIHALPQLEDILSWTPVDVMAHSIIDLALAPNAAEVMNVTNPTLNHWTRDLLPMLQQTGLAFEELPQREWLDRLRMSNPDPAANPPIKLVEFFARKYDHDQPSRVLLYDTNKAQAAAPALRHLKGLTPDFVARFIAFFRQHCWSHCKDEDDNHRPREVIFLTGPCGCGKSTAARHLQKRYNIPTIEGDDLHSLSARQKMAKNIPLSDSDRCGWFAHIRGAVMDRLQHSEAPVLAVTCSALRTVYRDELRQLSRLLAFPVQVRFVLLDVARGEELKLRVRAREVVEEAHYMKSGMVDSQLEILEYPDLAEGDVVVLDASRSKEEVLRDVVGEVVGREKKDEVR
ncbi:hypothetical protein FE257_001865 [Aspergillus nanangensis]|uniref:gluconokinase n=1 Tax=Aspergillus nanangensis TaxID=2582783 RepID=A0AAD4GPD1_ASPNN|nr:hypothetical protein FE257_001865 [Aspergillus nanangensis]